jgi:hypothetical protein
MGSPIPMNTTFVTLCLNTSSMANTCNGNAVLILFEATVRVVRREREREAVEKEPAQQFHAVEGSLQTLPCLWHKTNNARGSRPAYTWPLC